MLVVAPMGKVDPDRVDPRRDEVADQIVDGRAEGGDDLRPPPGEQLDFGVDGHGT